ncbi:MAG TPA: DinB family protein [Nitrolancea sp.]|nr:DinB family protein [Nitrolancea sp.]
MAEQSLPLTTFYSGWGGYHRGLVKSIESLTPEQLALPAAANHWTIGMIAQHLVGNRVWWYQMWMGEGNPELAALAHWDPADVEWQPVTEASELVAGFESTWRMVEDSLAHWTPADLQQIIQPASQLSEEEKKMYGSQTRKWIIWHVLEHEIHHGGEISLALGNLGLQGAYGSM